MPTSSGSSVFRVQRGQELREAVGDGVDVHLHRDEGVPGLELRLPVIETDVLSTRSLGEWVETLGDVRLQDFERAHGGIVILAGLSADRQEYADHIGSPANVEDSWFGRHAL